MDDRKIVLPAPYLYVCQGCFHDAWIILPALKTEQRPTDMVTRQFASKEMGGKIIDLLCAGEYIASDEAIALRRELADSSLYTTNVSDEKLAEGGGLFLETEDAGNTFTKRPSWPPMQTNQIQ